MAILKTKPFIIVGRKCHKDSIIEFLQRLSCVQIENSENLKNQNLDETISKTKDFAKQIHNAIEIIEKFSKKQVKLLKVSKDFESFEALNFEDSRKNELMKISKDIVNLNQEIDNLEQKINEHNKKIASLKVYETLDLPLKKHYARFATILIGSAKGKFKKNVLLKKIGNSAYFEIISSSKAETALFLVASNENLPALTKILEELKFVEIREIESEKTPKEEISNLQKEIAKMEEMILEYENKIKSETKILNELKKFADYLKLKEDKLKEATKASLTEHTFCLEGFVNPKFEAKLKKSLQTKFKAHFESFNPTENSPICFSNNFFVAPVESVTKTYSVPSNEDVDPNTAMAFFYYAFFGLMFSDAGYGLILTLVCLRFAFSRKINEIKKQTFRMFMFCGMFTMFFGLMFGSFFGDSISAVSKTFFHSNFELKPIWIDTLKSPLTLLTFSILVGLFQIIVGLNIKMFSLLKQKKFKEAFFKTANWILALTGILILALGKVMNVEFLSLAGVILIVSGLILVALLSGYEKKGVLKIFSGILNLYGIMSYASDILSYSRLMALSIATGVIANVVNVLGTMAGDGFFGALIFVLASVFGHAINFGINILGAYVHTNRLQYVEFFSKFYTGGGRLFSPFKVKTNYFNFRSKDI